MKRVNIVLSDEMHSKVQEYANENYIQMPAAYGELVEQALKEQ